MSQKNFKKPQKVSKIRKWFVNFLADFGFRFDGEIYRQNVEKLKFIKDLIFNRSYQISKKPVKSKIGSEIEENPIEKSASNQEISGNPENQETQNTAQQKNHQERLILTDSLGKILRKNRAIQELSIAQIGSILRVSPKDIAALEEDEVDKISRNIYAAGLIRGYGKILKIDPKIIEAKIKEINLRSNTEQRNHNLLNIGRTSDLSPSKDSLLNFSLISLFVFAICLLIFSHIEDKSENTTNHRIISKLSKIKMDKNLAE